MKSTTISKTRGFMSSAMDTSKNRAQSIKHYFLRKIKVDVTKSNTRERLIISPTEQLKIELHNKYHVLNDEGMEDVRQEVGDYFERNNERDFACKENLQKSTGFMNPTRKTIVEKITTEEIACQVENMDFNMQCNLDDIEDEIFRIPTRSVINRLIKKKSNYKTHSKLLNFLRCKFHLKYRDHHFMNTLVHEARVWMMTNKHTCDNPDDYSILSSAVLAAFLISGEELEFRQAIKNRTNWDNMNHLNKTITGNLGKVNRIPSETTFIGSLLPDLKVKPRVMDI